jgi:hypothetical protein
MLDLSSDVNWVNKLAALLATFFSAPCFFPVSIDWLAASVEWSRAWDVVEAAKEAGGSSLGHGKACDGWRWWVLAVLAVFVVSDWEIKMKDQVYASWMVGLFSS